jgi:hypothetical protein
MSHLSPSASRFRGGAGFPPRAIGLVCALIVLWAARPSFASFYSWPVGDGPKALAVGDLNGDGRQDLVTANSESTVTVLLNGGGGRFGARQDLPTYGWGAQVAIGDLNDDDAPDLVVAYLSVSVFLGNGDGTFRAPADYFVSPGVATCVAVADVNEDGRQDVLAGNSFWNDVAVFPGIGDGTVGAPPTSMRIRSTFRRPGRNGPGQRRPRVRPHRSGPHRSFR